jgi:DNA-binding transcriptional ArsR family regulator
MSDDIEKIRKELDDVRRLKEELAKEVEDVRREKERIERRREGRDRRREREDLERHREKARRTRRIVKPHPPPPVRVPEIGVDLTEVTESLEDMMDGLGRQIEASIKAVDGLHLPGIRISKRARDRRKSKSRRSKIESIPPEQVAQVVSPLGSEERLKILDFLKTGGKSFNELEERTGKTGSSLTHHLNPLLDAGYVVKGEVRGTYYATVEGRLAYRLSQWLTSRVESQRKKSGSNGAEQADDEEDVEVVIEDDTDIETDVDDTADNYDVPEVEDIDRDKADDLDDLDWKD